MKCLIEKSPLHSEILKEKIAQCYLKKGFSLILYQQDSNSITSIAINLFQDSLKTKNHYVRITP